MQAWACWAGSPNQVGSYIYTYLSIYKKKGGGGGGATHSAKPLSPRGGRCGAWRMRWRMKSVSLWRKGVHTDAIRVRARVNPKKNKG